MQHTVETLLAERECLSETIRKYDTDLAQARKSIAQLNDEASINALLIRALTSYVQELERKLAER